MINYRWLLSRHFIPLAALVLTLFLSIAYLPVLSRALQRNSAMLEWVVVATQGRGQKPGDSNALHERMVRLSTLCRSDDGACLQAAHATLLASNEPSSVEEVAKQFELATTERAMLALVAADWAYTEGDAEKAVTWWIKYLSPEGIINRARIAVSHGDYAVAANLLNHVPRRAYPHHAGADLAYVLLSLATFHSDARRDGEAQIYLRWLILQAPERPEHYIKLGGSLMRDGRWEEARAAFETASHLSPGTARYYLYQAQALHNAGALPAAVEMAEQAVELDPTDADARRFLSQLTTELE